MNPATSNCLAKRPKKVLWVVSALLIYHVVAVLHTLVPDWGLVARFAALVSSGEVPASAETRDKAAAFPPIRPLDNLFLTYRILTGTRQDWQMFDLAPRDHNLEIVVEARDSVGTVHEFGPVLPGLKNVDVLADGRFYPLWARFEFWNETNYINAYLENVGKLLKQSDDPVYRDATLIYRKHVIQSPDEIRSSGNVSRITKREWWLPRAAWTD